MRRSAVLVVLALGMAAPAAADGGGRDPASLPAVPQALGDTTQDLVFKPLPACRIVDTQASSGPIGADGTRSFLAVAINSGANFTSQGGSATNCGTVGPSVSAVLLNVSVIAPTNAGGATVYKSGTTRPPTPSILYAAGAVQSSQLVVEIPNPLGITDFTIHTQFAANFTVDVVGLFTVPAPTALQCTQTSLQSSTIAAGATTFFNNPACPAGYATVVPYCYSSDAGVYSQGSGLNSNTAGLASFCAWHNTTGVARTVFGGSVCCRVPGR